jgi:hypothetical protein
MLLKMPTRTLRSLAHSRKPRSPIPKSAASTGIRSSRSPSGSGSDGRVSFGGGRGLAPAALRPKLEEKPNADHKAKTYCRSEDDSVGWRRALGWPWRNAVISLRRPNPARIIAACD